MPKDCENVAAVHDGAQEEECEYDEEADWTDWTGAVTYDGWSYGEYIVIISRTHAGLKTPAGGLMAGMVPQPGPSSGIATSSTRQ